MTANLDRPTMIVLSDRLRKHGDALKAIVKWVELREPRSLEEDRAFLINTAYRLAKEALQPEPEAQPHGEMKSKIQIGDLVTFEIPCVSGPASRAGKMKVAGTVTRFIYGGIVEVKTQNNGYYNVDPSAFLSVKSQDGAA